MGREGETEREGEAGMAAAGRVNIDCGPTHTVCLKGGRREGA